MYKVILLVGLFSLSSAAPSVGFGDATEEEIEQIRAGTYLATFNENPEFTYSYKVADEAEQTYMTADQSREGEIVTGSYSYVDANGALVSVTYSAGPDGYTEERSLQEGFVRIKPRKVKKVRVKVAKAAPAPLPVFRLAPVAPAPKPVVRVAPRPVAPRPVAPRPVVAVAPIAPAPLPVLSSNSITDLFGLGGVNSVKISTPVFNIEY